jgi:hypothetical protein
VTPPPLAFAHAEAYEANMRAVIRYAGLAASEHGLKLKQRYVEALDAVQRDPVVRPVERDPVVHFWEPPGDRFPGFAAHFLEDEDAPADVVVPEAQRARVREGVAAGLRIVEDYDGAYAEMVRTLTAAVVCVRRRDLLSATVSSHLGQILLHPIEGATDAFFAEALLHEGIHQAQFLDEMITGWYTIDHREMDRPEALVVSPIRRVRRPLNLTFNAVGVAAVLLDFLWWLGDRERAEDMCRPLLVSLSELKDREQLLTPRGQEVLESTAEVAAASRAFAAVA